MSLLHRVLDMSVLIPVGLSIFSLMFSMLASFFLRAKHTQASTAIFHHVGLGYLCKSAHVIVCVCFCIYKNVYMQTCTCACLCICLYMVHYNLSSSDWV